LPTSRSAAKPPLCSSGIEHDARDARIGGCRVDGAHQVTHLDLPRRLAGKAGQRPLQRFDAVLLHQLSARMEHQHAVIAHLLGGMAARVQAQREQQQHAQHEEEDHVDDHQAHHVDAASENAQEGPESVRLARAAQRWW
jgi:hypothetical protein